MKKILVPLLVLTLVLATTATAFGAGRFSDENGDGVCDRRDFCAGENYVDADNDGLCGNAPRRSGCYGEEAGGHRYGGQGQGGHRGQGRNCRRG